MKNIRRLKTTSVIPTELKFTLTLFLAEIAILMSGFNWFVENIHELCQGCFKIKYNSFNSYDKHIVCKISEDTNNETCHSGNKSSIDTIRHHRNFDIVPCLRHGIE